MSDRSALQSLCENLSNIELSRDEGINFFQSTDNVGSLQNSAKRENQPDKDTPKTEATFSECFDLLECIFDRNLHSERDSESEITTESDVSNTEQEYHMDLPTELLPLDVEKPNRSCLIPSPHTVWKARHKQTSRLYAVKFLSSRNSNHVSAERAIHTEVKTHRVLSHPYIIRLCGYYANVRSEVHVTKRPHKGLPALVLEYIESGSLDRQIKNRRIQKNFPVFEEWEASHIISQLCSAVRYLHEVHKIAHCDIKPGNVLYDRQRRRVKLADFGLAWGPRQFESVAKESSAQSAELILSSNACKGTLDYMAPEQVSGEINKESLRKVDVWSIGVCAYELLFGKPPFHRDSISSTLHAIVHDSVEFEHALRNNTTENNKKIETSISAQARSFIENCLSIDLKSRPNIDSIIKHEWLNLVQQYERQPNP